MLIQENLIIVVERNIEQKDRKVKASEFLVANHNHRITELQFIAFCNNSEMLCLRFDCQLHKRS